jgi:glutamine---fructose-6-phosphate transaminase (isomerizing)
LFVADVIEGPYFRDILFQPQALTATWSALYESAHLVSLGESLRKAHGSVVLTGMGASLAALVPLQLKLVSAGITAVLIETGELIHHARGLLRPGIPVVAVSQSGRSAETVRLLDTLAQGIEVIGVTNDATSPLATRSHIPLITCAGPEATVSCKTYVSSLLALDWLGAQLVGEDLQAARAELEQSAALVHAYLLPLQEHVDALVQTLADCKLIYFAGRGVSLAAAQAAGLITKEAVHFAAEGLSSAAFRHGPLEMVGPNVFLLVFEGSQTTAELNRNLVEEVLRRGGKAALCGEHGEGPFALPVGPSRLLPMVEALVPQMVTLALSARLGREAGTFTHATKITAVQ